MRLDHAKDLAKFVAELNKETDRGLPLVGAALIDEKLSQTLESFFCKNKSSAKLLTENNAPLSTFSSRIEACHALGLIDEYEYKEISIIRKIRNEFAHAKHGISFKTEKIRGLCSSLKSDLPEGADYPTHEPRFKLINAIVCVTLKIFYRPDWVKLERRESKEWVNRGDVRWRSFEEEKPPEGTSIMVMAKKKVE